METTSSIQNGINLKTFSDRIDRHIIIIVTFQVLYHHEQRTQKPLYLIKLFSFHLIAFSSVHIFK